jgi:hypothetical protein
MGLLDRAKRAPVIFKNSTDVTTCIWTNLQNRGGVEAVGFKAFS